MHERGVWNMNQRFGSISYAQNGEDFMLLNLVELLNLPQATYLDLGAYHPEILSNTKLLYDRGHCGVNVEADPKLLPGFILHRPSDMNISAGVGPIPGVMSYYICNEDPARNSFHKEMITNAGFTVSESISLPVLGVNSIILDSCQGKWPDILLTDVEGMDYDILKAAQFTTDNKPKIIVTEVGFDLNLLQRTKSLLSSKGYFTFCRLACNMIFIANEYQDKVLA